MLVELAVVEQRYRAVLEVRGGVLGLHVLDPTNKG